MTAVDRIGLAVMLEQLLGQGLQVEFEKDDAGYIAHVCVAAGPLASEMHTGIGDTLAGALEAAADGIASLTLTEPGCECGHPSDAHTTDAPDIEGIRGGRMCDRRDCYCLGYRPTA
jgi:hypothetical protein